VKGNCLAGNGFRNARHEAIAGLRELNQHGLFVRRYERDLIRAGVADHHGGVLIVVEIRKRYCQRVLWHRRNKLALLHGRIQLTSEKTKGLQVAGELPVSPDPRAPFVAAFLQGLASVAGTLSPRARG
jgi:hypothetical protein